MIYRNFSVEPDVEKEAMQLFHDTVPMIHFQHKPW